MKIYLLLLVSIAVGQSLSAQNTGIGTTVPQAKLHIKGSADTSQLVIDANTTQSNLRPLIRLRNAAGVDLMDIHSDDPRNIFVGVNAGRLNNAAGGGLPNTFMGAYAGSNNTTGFSLTALGQNALFSNTTGGENTAVGSIALYYNTQGSYNTAVGRGALYQNDNFDNTATGFKSLFSNTSGTRNTANGSQSLVSSIIGRDNTAMGYKSLFVCNADQNTAYGAYSLYSNTTGAFNVAVGYQADIGVPTSTYNTMVGTNAYVSGTKSTSIGAGAYVNGNNATAIGANAIIFGNNVMQLGNTITSVIATSGGYVITSDGRFKDNVSDLTPGLDFIISLHPVSYNFNYKRYDDFLNRNSKENNREATYEKQLYDKSRHREIGFVAQEVEKLCLDGNYIFNGVYKPQNDNDHYSLDYSKFVVPLVKAVQEQQVTIKSQTKEIDELKARLDKLEKLMGPK